MIPIWWLREHQLLNRTSRLWMACRLGVVVAIFASIQGESSAVDSAPPPTELNLEQVIAGLTRLDEAFSKPFALSFRQDYEAPRDPSDPAGEKRRTWLEVEMARRGPDVYCHVKNDVGGSSLVETTIYWKDGVAVERGSRGIAIWPFLIGQGMNYFNYTDTLFVDAYRGLKYGEADSLREAHGRTPSEITPYLLPRMINRRRRDYRLRDKQEEVDGHWCHVIEWPSRDVIWVDVKHGFAARQRVHTYLDVKILEWHNRELIERIPDIWLPNKQERRTFFGAESPLSRRGMLNEISHTVLRSISFEQLSDKDFTVPIPDEDLFHVRDGVRKMEYFTHAKSTDPMEAVWGDMESSYWWRDRNIGESRLFFLVSVCVLEIAAMVWLLRQWR